MLKPKSFSQKIKERAWREFTDEEIIKYRDRCVRAALRKLSRSWPWRNIAASNARVDRGIYLCALCGTRVRNKYKKLDHVDPIVSPMEGFTGWDTFIQRLFVTAEGWQVLCAPCHALKTKQENEIRRKHNKRSKDVI